MNRAHTRFLYLAFLALPACGGGGGGGSSATVVAPTNLVYSSSEAYAISQVAISAILPTIDGDPATFTVVPALPSGLVLDADTGAITGTPMAPSARALYDVKASNASGSVNATVALSVVAPARFAYAVSPTDSSISTFSNDVFTGELRRLGQVITGGTEAGPENLVFHPNGRFAYAPNLNSGNVSVFNVDPVSGWLDRRTPASCGAGPHKIAIDPAGHFLYVSNRGTDEIYVFEIDPTTGDLTQTSAPFATGIQPTDVKFDRTGKFLFVTARGQNVTGAGSSISSFTVDAVTGALTPTGAPLLLNGERPMAMALDPLNPVIYITLEIDRLVAPIYFDEVTGVVSLPVPATVAPTGVLPVSIAMHPTGHFAYIANQGDHTLKAYTVNPTTFALTLLATYGAGTAPTAVTVDTTGKFLNVVAKTSGEVLSYAIDFATGELTATGSKLVRGAPNDFALLLGDRPTKTMPRFVHVAGVTSGDVTTFRVDPANGALTQVASILTGDSPSAIAIDPRHRYAWVSNADSNSISIFDIDAATGSLSASLPAQAIDGKPTHVAVDPTGRTLYAVAHDVQQLDDGWLSAYRIDQLTGGLTLLGTQQVGLNPTAVAIEPTGRFLFTANNGTDADFSSGISVFAIDPQTGVPSVSAPPGVAPGVFDLAFHPNGAFAYAVLTPSNTLAQYSISRTSGQLTLVPPGTEAGVEPAGLVVTPNGKFAFSVAFDSLGTGGLMAHTIGGDGAISAPTQTIVNGLHPFDLVVDPNGRFVYATNEGSDSVTVARVDAVTGQLTLGVPVPAGVNPGAITLTSITQ